MDADLRRDAGEIIRCSIASVLPDEAVRSALSEAELEGRLHVIAIGKAAWQMASAAMDILGSRVCGGFIATKHGHSQGELPPLRIIEAGHPVPDEGSFEAGRAGLEYASSLTADDTLVFLVSGGASAIFELPLVPEEELSDITRQLLACGADIREMNLIRKRLSAVKGGKFAKACGDARIFQIVLSDVLGDDLETIASAPAHPDSSVCAQAFGVVEKYGLRLSERALELLAVETPKELSNVTTLITGSVRVLAKAAKEACEELGYETVILTDDLRCEAKDAGRMLGELARQKCAEGARSLAFIAAGETVVRLKGDGLGGRNQEIALSAAELIDGLPAAVFSVGSDGTDGPTDAAGGYVDGESLGEMKALGIDPAEVLARNDSYHALEAIGGLIKTGPTGTNVNDAAVLLIRG